MNDNVLKCLNSRAVPFLSSDGLIAGSFPDMTSYLESFGRSIDLSILDAVIDEGMRFDQQPRDTDGWFAPRVHAALRLSRSEAGQLGIWRYLAYRYSSYILWRWLGTNGKIPQERITGRDNRQAFSRLWWAAELGRNGSDYTPVLNVFHNQDAALQFLDNDAFHNRPLALAYAEYVSSRQLSSAQAKRLGKRINFTLTTSPIDVIAPDTGADGAAIRDWLQSSPDYTLMKGNRLPDGPDDVKVPRSTIDRVMEFVARIDGDDTAHSDA